MTVEKETANITLYVLLVVYLLTLVIVAKVAHRRKKLIASSAGLAHAHFGGSFGAPVLLLTTFSTVYSGFTVTGIPEEAYERGFVSLRWIGATLVIVAGMLVLYPRLRRLAVERGYVSPNDFISDRYRSRRARLLCAACGCVPMLIYTTAQMISFAAILAGITQDALPKWAFMLIFCGIILTLEVLGGMNSVVLTDAVQSCVMIASFLAVPFALAASFGSLPSIAAADCSTLEYVMPTSTSPDTAPLVCFADDVVAAGCVPSGCLDAVRPEFYLFPKRETALDISFFLVNMLAAPLQPHMVQRAYIAASDGDLRIVMGAMLVAPFLAQTPGILIGLTKAAFAPAWPPITVGSTAFAAVTEELMQHGPLQYLLVSLMTCSTLAAIMSTADSALMGASSVISTELYKGVLRPNATQEEVVRAGEVNSFVFCAIAFLMGLHLSVAQFGSIIVFQNGMLMQMMPAFLLGLFTNVRERPVALGLAIGLLSLLVMVLTGNPLDPWVPLINVAVCFNFAAVAVVHFLCPGPEAGGGSNVADAAAEEQPNFGEPLTNAVICKVMESSREPRVAVAALMLVLALASAPWYGTPGAIEPQVAGLPRWGLLQCGCYVVIFAAGVWATSQWQPPAPSKDCHDTAAAAAGKIDLNSHSHGAPGTTDVPTNMPGTTDVPTNML